jgi:hypothetical protein
MTSITSNEFVWLISTFLMICRLFDFCMNLIAYNLYNYIIIY